RRPAPPTQSPAPAPPAPEEGGGGPPHGATGGVVARSRCVSSLCHVFALRAAVEADRPPTGAGGTAAGLRRVLLAFRSPGEGPVRGVVRGGVGGGAARFDHFRVLGGRRPVDYGEPAGRAVREILAAPAWDGGGAADCASDRAHHAEPDREPGDLG